MGKNKPGVRNGTGPASRSYQSKVVGVGKRQAAGEKCPVAKPRTKQK